MALKLQTHHYIFTPGMRRLMPKTYLNMLMYAHRCQTLRIGFIYHRFDGTLSRHTNTHTHSPFVIASELMIIPRQKAILMENPDVVLDGLLHIYITVSTCSASSLSSNLYVYFSMLHRFIALYHICRNNQY